MELDKIRQEIDRIDTQMKELFLARMELSRQVVEEKKRTGGVVYVPEREREILNRRTDGVKEEFQPECEALFRHIMGISRTYQYSRLTAQAALLDELPDGTGEVMVSFCCGLGRPGISADLDTLALAGIETEEMHLQKTDAGESVCRMRLSGDFSQNLAKAAILQMLEENENLILEKVR